MKRLFGLSVGIFLLAGTVWAEGVSKDKAFKKCAEYIENKVLHFKTKRIPKEHKILVMPYYNYKYLGDTHRLIWTMKSPVYLANKSGIIKGTKGKTAAGCEVDEKTGRIKYLVVSDKEIIRPTSEEIEALF